MIKFNLPCKTYTRHYLESAFGNPVYMRGDSVIGKYFYSLVDNPVEHQDTKVEKVYETETTIIITQDVFLRKGFVLSKTNQREFNRFIEEHFKTQIRIMLSTMIEYHGVQITKAIECVYEKFNMDESIMPHELIRKDYQRYRKALEDAPFADKNIYGVSVPKK